MNEEGTSWGIPSIQVWVGRSGTERSIRVEVWDCVQEEPRPDMIEVNEAAWNLIVDKVRDLLARADQPVSDE